MTTLLQWDGEIQDDRDLNRKFTGTFVLAKLLDKKPDVCYISKISDRTVTYVPAYLGMKGMKELAGVDAFDIISPIPETGLYSVEGGGVAFLRRNPLRQYREGVCGESTYILLNDVPVDERKETFWSVMKGVFSPQEDRPLVESLKSITPGENVRLTRKFWLRSEKQDKQISLWSFRTRVGSWSVGKFFWAAEGRIFKEELKDALNFHAK